MNKFLAFLFTFFSLALSGQETKEQEFWNWFSKNSEQYFHFEDNQNKLFNELGIKLAEVDKGLTFEFSPIFNNAERELVISADGIKSVFPAVVKLVNAAPHIDKWKIVAFRQPHLENSQISIKSAKIDFKDVYFKYEKDGNKLGLELHIKGYKDNDDWVAASFLILDTILGEYDTEMNVSWIERKKLNNAEIKHLLPITDLPKIMNDFKKGK